MFQKEFLEQIKSKIYSKKSMINEIAEALNIGYDASYRRVSGMSKFSLQEAIILANKFSISLDSIGSNSQNIISKTTNSVHNEEDLKDYFENSYNSLIKATNRKNVHIYYSAKDIPIFYYLNNSRLSHFKYYTWLKFVNPDFRFKSFKEYYPSLDLIQSAKKLHSVYRAIPKSEIWDITTINSVLKQIHFYFQAGHLDMQTAIELCDMLKDLLDNISDEVLDKKQNFNFYYNELLLMDNNVLIRSDQQKILYVPFSMLSYFYTSDIVICKEAMQFFNNQIKNSKLMNASGEKDQNTFYFKMMQKIEALKNLIKSEQILDFQ